MKIRSLFLALALMPSCGAGKDDNDPTGSSAGHSEAASDEEISEGALDASLTDALEALSDANGEAGTAGLGLVEVNSSRSCSEEGGKATVAIERSLETNVDLENQRRKVSHAITGSSNLTRVWSKSDGEVVCNTAGKAAAIDWRNPLGELALTLTFERTRSISLSHLNKVTGKSQTMERSFSANGQRTVSFESEEIEADTITRTTSITSSVERKHVRTAKQSKTLSLSVATSAEAPLVVETIRDATSLALQTKTIKSGAIVATKDDDKVVSTTFSDVRYEFDRSGCKLVSGSIEASYTKNAEVVRTLRVTATDGVVSAADLATGEEIAGFEAPGCAIEDFAE